MDLGLEILSEDSDHPDPLFHSIITAMDTMKEATADKIYRKIQKEGATNYSKPQVDRALANALKYGIFEVRNNRYRVRDDVLDDEDTVYWKMQKKREQTPFRVDEDMYDKQHGQKLNPEKDNRRFKNPSNKECLHCGRIKKGDRECKRIKRGKKEYSKKLRMERKPMKKNPRYQCPAGVCGMMVKSGWKRKRHSYETEQEEEEEEEEEYAKKRKLNASKYQTQNGPHYYGDDSLQTGNETSESEAELLNSSDHSIKRYSENNDTERESEGKKSTSSEECVKASVEYLKPKWSSVSESDSEKACSSASEGCSQRATDKCFDSYPSNSRNDENEKIKGQYLSMFRDQMKKPQVEKGNGNPDWLECSDEPQGAVIQSNNVLIIEPMDSLTFKSPEHATYIS